MNEKLKKIVFEKLYEDLSEVEIIHHRDSIWFIDRKQKYWYFEFQTSGVLWWRYDFFIDFFTLFSSGRSEFESVLSEWVEEVLNRKINTTTVAFNIDGNRMEEALNCKVDTTDSWYGCQEKLVGEALNSKVSITNTKPAKLTKNVERVLNSKVNTSISRHSTRTILVEEVLTSDDNG
jgi:hypothetical protein